MCLAGSIWISFSVPEIGAYLFVGWRIPGAYLDPVLWTSVPHFCQQANDSPTQQASQARKLGWKKIMRRLLIGAVLASASALWPFSSSEKQDPPTPHPDAVPVEARSSKPPWLPDNVHFVKVGANRFARLHARIPYPVSYTHLTLPTNREV